MAYTSKQLSRLMVDKLRRTFGRDVSDMMPEGIRIEDYMPHRR